MFSIRHHSLTRLILHGLTIFGLVVLAAGVSATPAYALPPTNDDFLTPVVITVASLTHIIADINQATGDALDPFLSCESGLGQGDATVWYTFTPSSSGVLSVNTANSAYDTVVAVFMDDPFVPGTIIEVTPASSCNNDVSASVKTSALTLPLRGGIKYYIEVARDSLSPFPTIPDPMRLAFTFTPKVVAFGTAGGQKWDSNYGSVFAFSAGWTTYPLLGFGAYKDAIRISNNVNNIAVAYFDGINFDLNYFNGPFGGNLEVWVDDMLQVTLAQNNPVISAAVWNSPFYFDGVHKLVLKHTAGFSRADFDYITVYSFPDFFPPDPIWDLTATTGLATGQVTLEWTSVGDDGMVGTATSYEVQYMFNDGINSCAADWGNPLVASIINWGLPAPKIAGTVQKATLSGLVPGVDYLFCIAAIDDGGNYGLPSNDANAIALAGVPFDTGVYDDKNPGWTYVGNWKAIAQKGARNNTLHVSNKMGDYATFYFTGTQFVLTYSAGPIGALLEVYIDGALVPTEVIDTYSPFPSLPRIYTSPILINGPHFVKFVHNYFGPPPPQVQVTIDQIYVNDVVDGGAPDPISDLVAVTGANDGEVDLFWTATGDDPGGIGTATKYEVRYSVNQILTYNDWVYASVPTAQLLAPQPAGMVETVTVSGLTPGVHYYFAIRAYDNAFYEVLSWPFAEDADAGFTGIWNGAGFYDDTDPAWIYNGGWITKFIGLATNGTMHMTSLYATSAVFHFNGTGFILTFQKAINYGRFDVYIDGVKMGTIYQSTPPYQYQFTWDSIAYLGALPAGNHVVEFRLIGTRANIDDLQIIP